VQFCLDFLKQKETNPTSGYPHLPINQKMRGSALAYTPSVLRDLTLHCLHQFLALSQCSVLVMIEKMMRHY